MSGLQNFIKIFDEQLANAISAGGFSYITEKINENQNVFVFEKSDELVDLIDALIKQKNYSETIIVEDSKLNF